MRSRADLTREVFGRSSRAAGFTATGPSDPYKYYSHPIVGKLFRDRITMGLALLEGPYPRLLEIGYGSGLLLPYLASIAHNVYGLDLDADPESVARHISADLRCRIQLSRGNLLQTPYPDEFVDCVVTFSVLEHILETGKAVAEMVRICRPGGTVLVGMPAVNRTMQVAFEMIGFHDIDHHHVTTPRDFLSAAMQQLQLVRRRTLPFNLPLALGIYHVFEFRRPT